VADVGDMVAEERLEGGVGMLMVRGGGYGPAGPGLDMIARFLNNHQNRSNKTTLWESSGRHGEQRKHA
jgi:hypothetical protein